VVLCWRRRVDRGSARHPCKRHHRRSSRARGRSDTRCARRMAFSPGWHLAGGWAARVSPPGRRAVAFPGSRAPEPIALTLILAIDAAPVAVDRFALFAPISWGTPPFRGVSAHARRLRVAPDVTASRPEALRRLRFNKFQSYPRFPHTGGELFPDRTNSRRHRPARARLIFQATLSLRTCAPTALASSKRYTRW